MDKELLIKLLNEAASFGVKNCMSSTFYGDVDKWIENKVAELTPEQLGDKVYEAAYNPCIHESVYGTISLHRTRRGADMAMEFHKAERLKEWGEDESERWCIAETELKD